MFLIQLLAQWGSLVKARKDVVSRVYDQTNITAATIPAAFAERFVKLRREFDFVVTDKEARTLAKRYYNAITDVIKAIEETTTTEPETEPETEPTTGTTEPTTEPATTEPATTEPTTTTTDKSLKALLEQWEILTTARDDVFKRVCFASLATVAALKGDYQKRAAALNSELSNIKNDDAARDMAKRFYTLLRNAIDGTTPENGTTTDAAPATTTDATTTDAETTKDAATTPENDTTPENGTTDPDPVAYIVRNWDDFNHVEHGFLNDSAYDTYSVLTSLEESDKIKAVDVLAYAVNGSDIVGALVKNTAQAKPHGYLVSAKQIKDKSRAVFAFYWAKNAPVDLSNALPVFYSRDTNLETVSGYLVPVTMKQAPTTPNNTEKEVSTMTKEQATPPRPLSLVKNPESVRSNKRGQLAPRLVKSAAPITDKSAPAPITDAALVKHTAPAPVKSVDAAPVPDSEKSRLYIWKDGKKAYATTPAAAPEYRLRTILKVAHAYFDRCTHEWIFTYQKEVIRELVSNGARLVESRESVPGFDPAKLDLHERVKWEYKQGRVAWIEGRRFNLTSEPRGYYNGAPLSKRNSELVFRIPTYFLTEQTAQKVAKETGLTISLKPNAEKFAVRVPRFEKVDDDGNGIGSPVNYYWEKAYKQEDFEGLPQKSLESPDVVDLERIRRALGAAPNGNLLEAFRFAASKVASLANLTSERHALAVEIAACIALSSVGLVPRDFIKDVDQYAQQWRAALFATNGAKVALDKGQEAAIEILTSIGVKVPTASTAPAAKA